MFAREFHVTILDSGPDRLDFDIVVAQSGKIIAQFLFGRFPIGGDMVAGAEGKG